MFRYYVCRCFFCTPCNVGTPIAKAIHVSIEVKKVVTNSKISKVQGVTRQKKIQWNKGSVCLIIHWMVDGMEMEDMEQ